jgi:hypothetical protein
VIFFVDVLIPWDKVNKYLIPHPPEVLGPQWKYLTPRPPLRSERVRFVVESLAGI